MKNGVNVLSHVMVVPKTEHGCYNKPQRTEEWVVLENQLNLEIVICTDALVQHIYFPCLLTAYWSYALGNILRFQIKIIPMHITLVDCVWSLWSQWDLCTKTLSLIHI